MGKLLTLTGRGYAGLASRVRANSTGSPVMKKALKITGIVVGVLVLL